MTYTEYDGNRVELWGLDSNAEEPPKPEPEEEWYKPNMTYTEYDGKTVELWGLDSNAEEPPKSEPKQKKEKNDEINPQDKDKDGER